jgi:predicted negative regulator of RcsB-dependent stress response
MPNHIFISYARKDQPYARALSGHLRQRGFAMAYNDRGVAYVQKGETAQAAADFAKVLELSSDPQLRQKAEEQLKALGVR